ncbi:Lrp/AsnC family transcriptional regulator [Actinoplanes sp. NPDC051851]|uniref:Lrp/AsnC family transcriptional regulator n=1 Tax=Actinoplanes sp. NPDC051851 TaxID=3154753 RepID=UPI00343CF170
MTLDTVDLKLLQALQLDGRVPFSRIAEALGVSDQTIARRFRRLQTSIGLRVVGMTDESRLGGESWIVRVQCTPDSADRLAETLARRPDTAYVALLSGGAETVCAMRPRTRQARNDLLLDRLQRTPRVIGFSAYCLLHRFAGSRLGRHRETSALTVREERILRPQAPAGTTARPTLDAVDEHLLAALFDDGRASTTALGRACDQSEEQVRRRLGRLLAAGVLYFDVQHAPEALGLDLAAMLWLTVSPSALATVGRALAGHPEVEFAAAVSGRINLAAEVRCRGAEELYAYLTDRLGALDGVQSVETTLILRQVKWLALPLAR